MKALIQISLLSLTLLSLQANASPTISIYGDGMLPTQDGSIDVTSEVTTIGTKINVCYQVNSVVGTSSHCLYGFPIESLTFSKEKLFPAPSGTGDLFGQIKVTGATLSTHFNGVASVTGPAQDAPLMIDYLESAEKCLLGMKLGVYSRLVFYGSSPRVPRPGGVYCSTDAAF